MGCGSSKSAGNSVATNNKKSKDLDENSLKNKKVSKNGEIEKNLINRENPVNLVADLPGTVPENESEAMPAPVTFEIPAVDKDSIIKKHPPKRLQKLEEQQINLNEDRLIEKQVEAKERRQKLLQERVSSSRLSASRGTRRTPPKDSPIPEQIEHEKTVGSPTKSKMKSEALEF